MMKPFGQACFPARILELVIRMAEMDGAMHGTRQGFALTVDVCMRFMRSRTEGGAYVNVVLFALVMAGSTRAPRAPMTRIYSS